MIKEHIDPSSLWVYFATPDNIGADATEMIAENKATGIQIWAHMVGFLLKLTVEADGVEIANQFAAGASDSENAMRELEDKYLGEAPEDAYDGSDDDERWTELQDLAEESLDDAIGAFLDVVLEGGDDLSVVEFADLKEALLMTIARSGHTRIYRPMEMEDEDGNVCWEEYPYECMDLG